MPAAPLRRAAVAGRFYPADPAALRDQVEALLSAQKNEVPRRAIGCIAPHAGYFYSGHVAAALFSAIEIPELCVVLCPNHTGMGRPLAIMSEGAWETPLGSVEIASNFAEALRQRFPLLEEDSAAHQSEHAVEVELPFLQMRQPNLRIVPLALGTRNFEALEQLGLALADTITHSPQPVLVVASSDMNHYESDAITRVKDAMAIEAILALAPQTLHQTVMTQNIGMCGLGPAVTMLTAARTLGATSAKLIEYATSGNVSGDMQMVVGYAAIAVY
jgi:MEMO1 family protein